MLMKAFAIFSQVEHSQPNCKRRVPCVVAGKLSSVYFSYILYPDDKGGFMFSVFTR